MATEPSNWVPGEPVQFVDDGFNVVYWPMPEGVPLAGEINFTFDILGNSVAECMMDTLELGLATMDLFTVPCTTLGSDCEIFSNTTEGGEQVLDLIVSNGVMFSSAEATSTCIDETTEEVTVDVTITGLPTLIADDRIYFFYDVNMNGVGELGTDVLLSEFVIPNGTSNTVSFTQTFNVTNDQLCHLVMEMDGSGLTVCPPPPTYNIDPVLQNAGADFDYCGTPIILGSNECDAIGSYTYEWTAISPASTDDLSATNILEPTLTVDLNIPAGSTLTYILTTTRGGCGYASSDEINVTIASPSDITITSSNGTTICGNGSTVLTATATGAISYEWSDGSGVIGTGATITVNPSVNSTYTVSATDTNGCVSTETIDIVVGDNPTVSINDPGIICAGSSVQLTTNVSGGDGNYTFSWTGQNITNGNTASPTITPGTSSAYTVVVTDGNGCSAVDVIQVTVDNNIPSATTTNDVVCPGEQAFVIASGGTTIIWTEDPSNPTTVGVNGINGSSINFNTDIPGNYTFYAEIEGGCEDDIVSLTITVLDGPTNVAVNSTNGTTICLGESTVLSASALGSAITYQWSDGSGIIGTTSSITVAPLTTTTYTVVATNSEGCTREATSEITVDADVPNASAADAQICSSEQTVLTATGGTSYSWIEMSGNPQTGTLSSTSTSNPTFSAMQGGTYQFEVTVTGGCSDQTLPVSVLVDAVNITSPLIDLDECNGSIQGVSINIDEDIQSYTITGAPFQSDAFIGNMLTFDAVFDANATNYLIEITGVSGCSVTTSFNFIECACIPTMVVGTTINNSNCGGSSGSATINISGNPSDYSFTWIPNLGTPSGAGNIRTDLPAGVYEVEIEEIGEPGCITNTLVVIGNSDGPVPTSIVTTPATCADNDGTARLTPSNWIYTWVFDGLVTDTRTDLASGLYGVEVVDPSEPGCNNFVLVVIQEDNDLVVDYQVLNAPTCNNADGEVQLIVTGGSGNYNFVWNDGGTGSTRNDLVAGTYLVNIEEIGGQECTTSFIFAIPDSDVPNAAVTINDTLHVTCPGEMDGEILYDISYPGTVATPVDTIITDGFTEWTNGTLRPGQYCLELEDANGCIIGAACFEIEEPTPITANISTMPSCSNGGSIDVMVMGGTGLYTYDWADLSSTSDPRDRSNLAPGNYQLTISDSNGCMITIGGGIVVDPCPCSVDPMIESVTMTESRCGESSGAATIQVLPSPNGLTYTWSPNVGTPNAIGNERTDLPAGGYSVTVADVSGECTDMIQFAITNSDGPQLDNDPITTLASCGAADGSATLSPGTYTYNWSDGGNGATRNDLIAGTYFVTFSDPTDPTCISVEEINIGLDNTLNIDDIIIDQNSTCGNFDGIVTAIISGGSGNYNYQWSFGGDNAATTGGVPGGAHTLIVVDLDAPECEATKSFIMIDGDVVAADITIDNINHVTCGGAMDGFFDYTVTPQPGFQGTPVVTITNGNSNTGLSGGEYCIVISDGNGCVAGGTCVTINENDPLVAEYSISGGCTDDGAIDVTVEGGTGTYTYEWNDMAASEDRMDLEEGTYIVTITDGDGCSIVGSNLVVECTQCLLDPQVTSATIIEATCGNSDGSAIITTNVDPTLLTYTWEPNVGTPGATGNIRTDLPAGGYTVTVSEAGAACSDIVEFAITNQNGPELDSDPIITDASCAANDGTATLSPVSFNYQWNYGGMGGASPTDLGVGTYFVTFSDPSDPTCTGVEEINIGLENNLEVDVVIDMQSTCGNADGQATANVTNGGGTYTYNWSFGGTNMTETNIPGGVHAVTVTDTGVNACETSTTFLMTDSDASGTADVININITDVSCFGAMDGNIDFDLDLSGTFVGPEQVTIYDGLFAVTNGMLSGGMYCIEVRDANGCVAGGTCVTINENDPLEAEFSISGGCADDGVIDVTVEGGTGTYTYEWGDAMASEDREDLVAGTYAITITDGNGCTLEGVDLIVECTQCLLDPQVTSVTIIEATCGNSDGQATITTNVDPTLLVYTWSPNLGTPGATDNIRTELPAGGYTVTVSEASGACFDVVEFAITNQDGPELDNDPVTTNASCAANDGTATLSPASYNYQWNYGGMGGAAPTDLGVGTYFVTFSDPLDPTCTGVEEINIGLENNLEVDVVIDMQSTCGNADGQATANVSNGGGTYIYNWSFGGTDMTETNIPAGVHAVTVTDAGANACEASTGFIMTDSDASGTADVININITDVSCFGAMDGNIDFDLDLSGTFVGPEQVTIYHELIPVTNGMLSGGEYCIEIRDANGCVAGGTCVTINENDPLEAEFSISGGCFDDGAIDVSVTGGTGTYNYEWSDQIASEDREDLIAGTYTIIITDGNGCTLTGADLLVECTQCLYDPQVESVTILEATCGNSDGTAIIDVNVDPSLLTYTWEPNIGTPGVTGNIRTDLPAGGYTVTVSEASGACSDIVEFAVTNQDGPELDNDPITTNASCSANDGTATLSPAFYDYQWNYTGMGGATPTDLGAGTYFVTFSDPADPTCTSAVEINIGLDNDLDVDVVIDMQSTCGNADGQATANVSNGGGTYTYDWSFGGTNMTEMNIPAGVHAVTVTDAGANACQASETFIMTDSDASGTVDVTINNIMDVTCAGAMDGAIDFDIIPSGTFIGPEQVTIYDGLFPVTNGNLSGGSYCIEVRDANGCVAGGACFDIEEPDALDVEFSISGGCNEDGVIDIIAMGGTGNYTYNWLDLPGTSNIDDRTGLSEGLYTVIVTDENGCAVAGYGLPVACPSCMGPTIEYTLAFESICGESNGSAQVVLTENPEDYVFEWMPDNVGTLNPEGNELSGVPAGLYMVSILDTINTACSDSVYILVTNEDGPEASIETIMGATCGESNGTATLLPNDYIYTWSDGQTGSDRSDLEPGVYEVIFTTADDLTCYNVLMVEIPEMPSFDLSANVTMEADPGQANGAAEIIVTGGTGPFTFYWNDGGTGNPRSDLIAGTYTVIVIDDATGCENQITFTVGSNVPETATITINTITNVNCHGEANGSVDFDVTYDAGFEQPATVVITDGFNQYGNMNLDEGEYCINVFDASGNLVTFECFEIIESEELELSILGTYAQCPDTGILGSLEAMVMGGQMPYNYDWDVLPAASDPALVTDLPTGTYNLTVTDANGCSIIANDILLEEFCLECEYFNGMDTLTLSTNNCGDTLEVCAGLPLLEYLNGNYDIYLNGNISNDDIVGCDEVRSTNYFYGGIFGMGESGPYYLDSWIVEGTTFEGEFLDMPALVDSMNVWDPTGNWMLDTLGLMISGGNSDFSYSMMELYPVAFPSMMNTMNPGQQEDVNGIAIPIAVEGVSELVIVNTDNGCSDTLIINYVCLEYTLEDSILLGTVVDYCFDIGEVLDSTILEGTMIDTIYNACPENSGTSVIFEIDDPSMPCITYTGITPGTDTACLVVCDELDICDTIYYYVDVYPSGPEIIYDTIVVAVDTQVICLDTLTDLGGEITGIVNYCDDGTDILDYSIDEDTWCVSYWGISPGEDSLCLAVTDIYGNVDTVIVNVLVTNTTPEIFCDTIFIGPGGEHCLDLSELPGNIVSAENICEDESTGVVEFFIDQTDWCVTYQSVEELGRDTACIILCDDLGYCDTTYFCIEVIENFDLPIAIDDYDTTVIDVPVVVNVKANDTIFGVIDTLYILDGAEPIYGEAYVNLDCTITYDPDPGFCSVTDEFQYVVCNPNGCDTATVYVYIACEELTIFNGFSPNGDDLNEVFYIDGIEDYPNNYLCIFNRWGNRVYEKVGYNNEWHGEWEGNNLPDGTYFYILKLDRDSDGDDDVYKGYLQIHR